MAIVKGDILTEDGNRTIIVVRLPAYRLTAGPNCLTISRVLKLDTTEEEEEEEKEKKKKRVVVGKFIPRTN